MERTQNKFDTTSFDKVTIKIASPDTIRSWSYGEIKNPETINYRTFKPERGGLFCERIFGPTKDWECSCGKYKRIKHKGVVCDRCGVEVTLSKVRRDRMGHIELAVPVSHIWFFKSMPSSMGNILGLSSRALERVLYYEDFIVIDPGESPYEFKQIISEPEYREIVEQYPSLDVRMGADAVKELLQRTDLDELSEDLRAKINKSKSRQAKAKISKRLKVIDSFRKSGNKAEWMILDVIPVIPPDLRPLVPLEGGRFATSDLNDLYRRVINRNNRLKTILQLKTPEVIIRNEKRMLQEAVDALFDNGRHGRPVVGVGNRPFKSLSEMLKGKQGRFRQNLLGKRVDYSGRSVIVVGPELNLNQCGLPKKMALELFEPFIIRKLKEMGHVHTIRSAKKLIEKGTKEVFDILEEVIKGHPIFINRAPTLHRLGIQAFDPVLIEGEAITIHPLVCPAFNADFDGDQMAVHIPLSAEAQIEARLLMYAPNNIFSPSSGRPIATPTQDIALGCYYLTLPPRHPKEIIKYYSTPEEILLAYSEKYIDIHDWVYLKIEDKKVKTTVGRVIFNEVIPEELGYVNEKITKKKLGKIIHQCYLQVGLECTVKVLDKLKTLGFEMGTMSGITISMSDLIIPTNKMEAINKSAAEVAAVEEQYKKGGITEGERYNKVIDIWTHTTDMISDSMYKQLEENMNKKQMNPVFMMVDSGARGSKQQIRQLAGTRGLMAKPSGEIIESPILSNFKEGLSVLEYFISTHGARKGLADTALKTADSGYLTRRLVDVAQDMIIREEDCNTLNGIEVTSVYEGEELIIPLEDRLFGRVALEDVRDPRTGTVIVEAGSEIDEKKYDKIAECDVEKVRIRSVLTCETKNGICQKCYGRNLANARIVNKGEAVGIIAAQSIGEPGTQLTMRTFHIGGTASQIFKQPEITTKHEGRITFVNVRTVKNAEGLNVVLNKNGYLVISDENEKELERHSLILGAIINVDDGVSVKKGDTIVRWDPYNVPILTEIHGTVALHDIVEGITMKREVDEATGLAGIVITEHKEELHPQIIVKGSEGEENVVYYSIPTGAHIVVEEGQKVEAGNVLAKTPRKISKTKDITGGLPRVAELFEARRPKDAAEIAKIDGIVEFGPVMRGKRKLVVRDPETGVEEEHLIPIGKHLTVYKADRVKKGQQLTEGPIVPQEILEVCGPKELQEYLVNQIQEVYRLQGVTINDKHIELIIKQMLRKVRITEPGDTEFLYGEQIDKAEFESINKKVAQMGGVPAQASPLLMGITKASLGTESFISAASFQETTRVLTEAAAYGKVDQLKGFKENVIMGHMIPAGTGFTEHRHIAVQQNIFAEEESDVASKNSKQNTDVEEVPVEAQVSFDSEE